MIQGAAWTVPVIALAVATPAAAASAADDTLAFTLPAYSGVACQNLTNVEAKLTTSSGTPDAGKPITITLSDGYTFADGSSTFTGTTGANGTVTLPTVRVPAVGGTSVFTATSGALTASAAITAPKVAVAFRRELSSGQVITFPDVPAGSMALGDSAFLSPAGDLWFGNALIASGVASAGVPVRFSSNVAYIPFISSTGVASRWNQSGPVITFPDVPAGSTAIGDSTFLSPDGGLWFGNTLIATGVSSVGVPVRFSDNDSYTSFISSAGVASRWRSSDGQVTTFPNVPSNATAIGDSAFLTPDGDFWFGNTRVATAVSSVGVPSRISTNDAYTPYIVAPTCPV